MNCDYKFQLTIAVMKSTADNFRSFKRIKWKEM